ncbi:hypothetical protein [Dongia deserti]|uniref:hypothetical protein n=1 Tax=Dongia deserti TaxID=2268030 RepID=UPI000E6557C2|nr:hypothetical protein [Dongia deserti]
MTFTELLRAAAFAAIVAAGVTFAAAPQTNAADPHHPDAMIAQATPPSEPEDAAEQGQGAQPGQPGMMGQDMMMQHGMMGARSMMGHDMMGMRRYPCRACYTRTVLAQTRLPETSRNEPFRKKPC